LTGDNADGAERSSVRPWVIRRGQAVMKKASFSSENNLVRSGVLLRLSRLGPVIIGLMSISSTCIDWRNFHFT
jgi:hypothetical protein